GEGPVVEGDDMKISRIMYHIIDNALRYTESGTVTVSGKTDADFVTVTVSDTGIGIDPARHDEIFIPFRRLAYPHDGCLGLGLSVVLETLHLISGSMAVHSPGRGQGTTVTVRIPIKMNSSAPLQTFDRGPEGFGLYLDMTQPRPSQRLLMKRTVGLLAHELRIPFLGVIGCSDYLVRTEEKKPLQKQLGMINRCGVRLVDVIDVVRDAALILELPAGLVVKSVQIPMLVENIHKQLDVAKDKRNQPMKKREVNFFNECPASLPDIQGEELKLAKIIEHVAENALKFTNKGHVRIDAKATKGMVTLIVEDTGIGIPDEDQERVFQPFVRLEPHNYYGLGLGLTVVYEIVKLAGGSIEIESAKDKGTTFRIRLPTESPKTVYLDHLDAVFVEASKRSAADATSADGRPRESPADPLLPTAVAAASPPATTPGESSPQAPTRSNSRSVGFLDVPERHAESSRGDSTTGLEAEPLNAPPAAAEEEGQTQQALGSREVERLKSELGRQQQANTETAAALQVDWQQRCEALVKDNLQLRREMVEERERSAGEIRELSSELGSVKKESQELQDAIGRQEKNVKRLEEERAAAVAGEEKANRQFAAEKKLREEDREKASGHPAHTAEMSKVQSRLEVANEELVACRRELKESRAEVETLKGSDSTEVNGLVASLQARLDRANETIEELREEIDESARKRAALSRELSRLRNGRSEDAVVEQKESDSHAFLHAVEQLKDVASFMQQEIEQHVSRRGVETSEALRCLREENEKLRTELRMVRASGEESQHPKDCQEGGDFEELKRQNEHLRAELGHRSARILRLQQEARRLRSHIAQLSLGLQEKEDEAEDHSLRVVVLYLMLGLLAGLSLDGPLVHRRRFDGGDILAKLKIDTLMAGKKLVQLRDLKFEVRAKVEQDRVFIGMVYKVGSTRTGTLGKGRLARTAQYSDAWVTDFHPYSPTYVRLRVTDSAAAIKLERGDVWYFLNPELTPEDDKVVISPVALTVGTREKMLKIGTASGVGDCEAMPRDIELEREVKIALVLVRMLTIQQRIAQPPLRLGPKISEADPGQPESGCPTPEDCGSVDVLFMCDSDDKRIIIQTAETVSLTVFSLLVSKVHCDADLENLLGFCEVMVNMMYRQGGDPNSGYPVNSELDRSGLCQIHLEELRSKSMNSRTMTGGRLPVAFPGNRLSTDIKMSDALLKPSEDALKSKKVEEAAERQGQVKSLSLRLSRQRVTSGECARTNDGYINAVIKNFNPEQTATSVVPLLGRGLGEASTIDFVVKENEQRQPRDSGPLSSRSPTGRAIPIIPKMATSTDNDDNIKFSDDITRIKTKLEGSATDEIHTVAMLKEISQLIDDGLPADIIRKSGIYTAIESLADSTSSRDIVRPVAETVSKKLEERCKADLQTKRARRNIDVASKISSSGFSLTDLMDRCVRGNRMMPQSSLATGKRKREDEAEKSHGGRNTKKQPSSKVKVAKKPTAPPMSEEERARLREMKSILKR
ncbi:hypothetical protein FOZ62_010297, partial [Perkinsus olseni]